MLLKPELTCSSSTEMSFFFFVHSNETNQMITSFFQNKVYLLQEEDPAVNPYHTFCAKFVCIRWCFLGGKTVGPRAPVSKVESKTFHRRKGTLQAFSRS